MELVRYISEVTVKGLAEGKVTTRRTLYAWENRKRERMAVRNCTIHEP